MKRNWWQLLLGLVALGCVALRWKWVGENSAQFQTAGTLVIAVFTIMVWHVYSRQATIMDTQSQILTRQAGLQEQHSELERQVAIASLAPLVVPSMARYCTYPSGWPHHKTTPPVNDSSGIAVALRNIGRAPALDLRVTAWHGERPDQFSRQDWLHASTRFVGSEENAVLTVTADTPQGRGVLALHYKDFLGEVWHTTWNLSPQTGEYQESECPFVWNSDRWQNAPAAQRFCPYCSGQSA